MNRQKLYLPCLLALLIMSGGLLSAGAPATAQGDSYVMCINVPEEIALGNTEQLTIGVYTAGSEPADHTCEPLRDLPDQPIGAGLRGVELGNFNTDPADNRLPGCVALDSVGDCNWVFQATGEPDSSHNLVEYLYIEDASRTSGIRTIAIMSQRITIIESLSLGDQVGQFFDSTVGRVAALAGTITAVIGAYAAWRGLSKGGGGQ